MKKALRVLGFLLVFACTFYFVNAVMKFKYEDGIKTMDHFYDLPADTVDVLFCGSSHVGMNVDPLILWEEYGIASYNLWASFQPSWNSYYFIKEALQYQTPKLIVYDIFLLGLDVEVSDYSRMVKNTIGMRMSPYRIEATRVSTTPELFADVLLGWPTYHTRYNELTKEDFDYFFWKKHTALQHHDYGEDLIQPLQPIDVSSMTASAPLVAKQEEYLMKIIALCEENDIPLLLISAPFQISAFEQERFNTVSGIAAEHGIGYLNYNEGAYLEAGIVCETDFRDEGHLNMAGIPKYTSHLGRYLKANYALPDRREDPDHLWNKPLEETDDSLLYVLPERFLGDGLSAYVDTGIELYGLLPKDWTLKTEIDTRVAGGTTVYLSCFSEDSNHRGLLIRKVDETMRIIFGNQTEYIISEYGDAMSIALSRENDHYALYVDGKAIATGIASTADRYDGSLLIGAQADADGGIFRHAPVTVYSLQIYDRALPESEMKTAPERAAVSTAQADASDDEAVERLYRLPERFEGDRRLPYVDTGLTLFEDPKKSWTLLSEISPTVDSADTVYFSCFNETDGHYGGLLVRKEGDNLALLYGPNWGTTVDIPPDRNSTLAVVKSGDTYSLYVNGEQVAAATVETEAYGGNLIVGAQQQPDGTIFRTSGTAVYALEVYSGVLPEEDILGWKPVLPLPPAYPPADTPSYTLERPFLGDGASHYVDTEIRLYDDPLKDWSIDMAFGLMDEGVYASCFNEAGDYYGLLIRQTDAQTLTVITGRTHTDIPISPLTRSLHLAITKEGDSYSIYVDGALYAEDIVSDCPMYGGNLLLGCQDDANGQKFRFSSAKIDRFSLVDTVLTPQEVFAHSQERENTLRGW